MALSTDQPEQGDLVAPTPASGIPLPDEAARLDGQLMADSSNANYQLSRYLLRLLDADARRAEPISVAEELDLAARLAAVAQTICSRAQRRAESTSDELADGEPR